MGQARSVGLPLYSTGTQPQPFTAQLTTETPLAFTISPAQVGRGGGGGGRVLRPTAAQVRWAGCLV